jgi:excisionase family DNA binding protein
LVKSRITPMEEDTHSRREAISMRRNNPPFAALLFFTIASGKLWYGLQDGSLDARSIVWMTVIVAELGVYVFLRLVGESLPPLGRMYIPSQMKQAVSVKDSYRHLHSGTTHDLQTEHTTSRFRGASRTPPVTSKFCVGHAASAKATVTQGKMPYVEEDTYTPAEAAKILRLSKRRVIQLITEGDLEGDKDEGGRWHIPQRAIHDRLGDRPPRGRPQNTAESGEAGSERMRELEVEVSDLNYRLGRAEARAELTEVAESTLREQLQRERERADRLEEELRAEREKGFWRRLFGG